MRLLYTLLFHLALPIILLRLAWRGRKAPAYRQRWAERLGFYTNSSPQTHDLWFHAVSVGEVEAVLPLIQQLQQHNPLLKILVTTTTPTGSSRVQAVLKNSVTHVYLPYDIPFAIQRFFKQFKPQLAIIVETEIWLNLFQACYQNKIKLFLINARLSEKSARGYQKIPFLIQPALQKITIWTQSELDSARFIQIGAKSEQVKTLGNIKFDINISAELIEQARTIKKVQFNGRFVWLIASTHDNEEAQLLSIYSTLKQHIPELLLIIAPRHPERFDGVQKLAEQAGYQVVNYTSGLICKEDTDIYLLNTIGALKLFYATADVCFVGGSLVNIGGHNVLEPAAIGTPIIFGQYMRHFKTIADTILQANAAIQCFTLAEIEQVILTLYDSAENRQLLINNAKTFVQTHQGVTAKIAEQLLIELTHN